MPGEEASPQLQNHLLNLQMDTVHVNTDGYPTLIDFKRCKLTTERTYTIATSPWYTAPETLRREGAGLEVDYWSLGVLLYECMFATFLRHQDSVAL